jgi:hypothetical protein
MQVFVLLVHVIMIIFSLVETNLKVHHRLWVMSLPLNLWVYFSRFFYVKHIICFIRISTILVPWLYYTIAEV